VVGSAIKAGSKGIEEGREGLLGTVTGGVFGPSLKTTGRWGPPVSEGRERGGCTDSGLRESGPWAGFFSGPKFVPGVQFHFYFVFLLFSFLFPFFFYSDFQF
jgi:hypothetical protein